jgi:DNA-binding NtrC family response regulator
MREITSDVSVLLIEDDLRLQNSLRRSLSRLGCTAHCATSIAEAKEALLKQPVVLCLVDWSLPDGDGIEVVRWGLARNLLQKAYCITGFATTRVVVDAVRAGCTDVIEKPFTDETLAEIVKSASSSTLTELSRWRSQHAPYIIGEESSLVEVLRIISRVSNADCSVLITGESGTGKELIARAIHDSSSRSSGPMIALNCAAIPENLIESELFGHVKGAFTGAATTRDGHILAANNGTLFLDEIGEMPLLAQAKLLRVLQESRLTQVGSDRSIPVNVRIIAATNKDLEAMVEEKKFRGDLLYRLNVIQTELPPLRDRVGDIPLLVEHFVKYFNARLGCSVSGCDASALAVLSDYNWPGNIRELSNAIHRAVLLKANGVLTAEDFKLSKTSKHTPNHPIPVNAAALPPSTPPQTQPQPQNAANLNLKNAIDDVERQLILMALERSGGNRTEAAALLGLNRTTLVEKLRKLGS